MIVTFEWTTPALLAGAKTCTRREWNPKHAAKFHAGQLIDAWNTSPRNVRAKPHKVATIRLTRDPYIEWTGDAPPHDYSAEGFEWLEKYGFRVDGMTPMALWMQWRSDPFYLYVVRFEVVEYLEGPKV